MSRIVAWLDILILASALFVFASTSSAQTGPRQGAWVNLASDGRLLYTRDALGNRLPDFGDCGYKAGREPIPATPVTVTVEPVVGDATAKIQSAIDQVAAMKPDGNGLRGAVLLKAGEYQVGRTLNISASGVVLRGEGASDTGTRLRATARQQYTLINISGSAARSTVRGTVCNIVDKYVPVGSRSFTVDNVDGLAAGDTIVVHRPSTQTWIDALGMDQLANPWTPGSRDVDADRVITRIEGNRIFIDAAITTAIEARYGGGKVWRYMWPGRIQKCGVEHIKGISSFDGDNDEKHGRTFISVEKAENCWVRGVVSQYFSYSCVSLLDGAKWVSVLDAQCLDPVSEVTGGRRYAFNIDDAHQCLVFNCYTNNDRHQYVTGSGTTGPHAFVSSTSEKARSDAGPHHRWASGVLWDRITVNGHDLNIQNRGNLGSGHGWAGANCVVWNSKARGFVVQNPPTARNWLVGSIGTIRNGTVHAGPKDPGIYDAHGSEVFPSCLWGNQRNDLQNAPGLQIREYVAGDIDEFTADPGEVTPIEREWETQVAVESKHVGFDDRARGRWRAWTHAFSLDARDSIVSATLWVSLRAVGDTAFDRIYFDYLSVSKPLSDFASRISTSESTVIRIDLGDYLSALYDGKFNLAVNQNVAVDWSLLELRVAPALKVPIQTVTLSPESDVTVRMGTTGRHDYASDATVTVSGSESTSARALLRWDLSGVAGKVIHAKVRLRPITVGQGELEHSATVISSDGWDETAVTWQRQPFAGPGFMSWNPKANQPVEFNVTSEVLAALAGNRKLGIQLRDVPHGGKLSFADYGSRENEVSSNRPQLIIITETPMETKVQRSGES